MQRLRIVFISLFTFFICEMQAQIVLNEMYLNPDAGAGSNCLTCAGGKEYIELYNKGCNPVNVAGYFIAHK